MNSTIDSSDGPDEQSEETIGPYGYSIGVSFGILVIIIVITYSYYVYTRIRARPNPDSRDHSGGNSGADYDGSHCLQGLDEATLFNYPKLLYSEANKPQELDCPASGCSICLQDYKDIDMLRMLPECGHFFHLKCVDPWLRLHPNCPICRNSAMSTLSDNVVVEVVPVPPPLAR